MYTPLGCLVGIHNKLYVREILLDFLAYEC